MVDYDALIVGARCAGATLATRLAQAGWRVAIVDRDPWGTDLCSAHVVTPETRGTLDGLGVLEALRRRHELRPLRWGDRRDRLLCLRRTSLDRALVDAAQDAGCDLRLDDHVSGPTDAGSVNGVMLADGRSITARWVFGADGRETRLARKLALGGHRNEARASMLFSYWQGLPETDRLRLHTTRQAGVSWVPCEDDVHLLISHGSPHHARGDQGRRERRHLARLRESPATLEPARLDAAQRISEVRVVPEDMAREFLAPTVAGDAQRIGDAIARAIRVAELMLTADPALVA